MHVIALSLNSFKDLSPIQFTLSRNIKSKKILYVDVEQCTVLLYRVAKNSSCCTVAFVDYGERVSCCLCLHLHSMMRFMPNNSTWFQHKKDFKQISFLSLLSYRIHRLLRGLLCYAKSKKMSNKFFVILLPFRFSNRHSWQITQNDSWGWHCAGEKEKILS